ncbi:phosphotransferase [Sphaerisporangium sp. B11E5]|uniref:phosphotransferase n=1 Tax=Sphaerisporangium sp. B11E5 TaxID=3153563 RepID=UPI00325DD62B
MSCAETFTKWYANSEDLRQAAAHHAWLSEHAHPLRQPPIVAVHPDRIDFTFLHGRHASIMDLGVVAALLGRAHVSAWTSDLHQARLTAPHALPGGRVLADFVSPRVAALRRRQLAGLATERQVEAVQPLFAPASDEPVAFYKDTNPRNVLITPAGEPVMVDIDDVTLAPFGYDLAKLVVTLAMTYGAIPADCVTTALAAYNSPLLTRGLRPVSENRLLDYAELHHLLTRPYLGMGGYRHPWPTVRSTLEKLR